ncbi:MAG: UvrD-helicase domain-containing protein [Deltaproteobacteria bacterium]|jgi:DNA helicase-2/ATP-dependent DNA helicase PcrA|nr:UvrD-helicase domain-containing protein [Deltaproteobacteria bacterium]
MRRFFVDLHIHSCFSRATSHSLIPSKISTWAGYKGLDLVGTGDLTHPGWLDILEEDLTQGPDGLYYLNYEPYGPKFVPTGEISAIYKQGGKTRKIHLVVVAPNLEAARRFSQSLGRLGNVTSDGRPILGLSARNILEIALTADPEMEIIPAHIWTPWFSLFGSKSGFDDIEECFGDLTKHIHALETGLSSDPEMNRLISALDGYTLVSSSDAHSPEKLGREATVLSGELSFAALKQAFRGGPNLVGTVEFFPEEGKYHLDGHAQCGQVLTPAETKAVNGLCPRCGKPLTVGVLSRVMELADRESAPLDRLPDWHLLPLIEVISQALDLGPTANASISMYHQVIAKFGSEYKILMETPLSDIIEGAGPILARAIERMRLGQVETSGGYDGLFGQIKVLSRQERLELMGQGQLFSTYSPTQRGRKKIDKAKAGLQDDLRNKSQENQGATQTVVKRRIASGGILSDLSTEQHQAVTFAGPALALTAGPGAGKTMVLVRRAVYLIRKGDTAPEKLLLTTYTRKAAETLQMRLNEHLGPDSDKVTVSTLHSLAHTLADRRKPDFRLADEETLTKLAGEAGARCNLSARRFQNLVALYKNHLKFNSVLSDRENGPGLDSSPELGGGELGEAEKVAYGQYQKRLGQLGLWDYDDLILEATEAAGSLSSGLFAAVLADEFQDFSLAQYRFFQAISQKASVTVIGDPEQSIYGFRGAYGSIFQQLASDRIDLVKMDLTLNFRSNPAICQASEVMRPEGSLRRTPVRKIDPQKITRVTLDGPNQEADWVVKKIRSHLGVTDLGYGGSSSADRERMNDLTLADIAVIFRLRQVGQEVAQALERAGLPYQMAGEVEETAADGLDFKADKISLLTMHAAKGLEFRLVLVIGLEEGLCPFEPEGQADDQEEKRLFYVALTRAKDVLYLTRSTFRFIYGRKLPGNPSAFWNLLPPGLCSDIKLKSAREKRLQPKAKGGQGPRLF